VSVRAPQVLVVFGDDEHRAGLASALCECGADITVPANCSEALQLLASRRFALVFCEDGMAGCDFRKVLETNNSTGGATGVVVCSRRGGLDEYLEVMRSGAFDFIVPPYRPGDLVPIIATVVRGYRNEGIASGAAAGLEPPATAGR
jgi:DNA-binding NtrC family response regulator